MKNNEIMISARFEENGERYDEISFLVLKDITLKALIQGLYYGLQKDSGYEKHFQTLKTFLQTHKQIPVLNSVNEKYSIIDFTSVVNTDSGNEISIYDEKIDNLGFATSSTLLFTDRDFICLEKLFEENLAYNKISDNQTNAKKVELEYNISTRRLNVVEPSVIDILPAGEMPKKDKGSIFDVIIPTVLSTGGMLLVRALITNLIPDASNMGDTMLLMTAGMGIVSFVTTLYNYRKKKKEHRVNATEWKQNYEKYIKRKIEQIKKWQHSDIEYLNNIYPSVDKLFENVSKIDSSIFSRSQSDNDFMKISMGKSDEVKPLFEIKSERKENIYYDINYTMNDTSDGIEIDIPLSMSFTERLSLIFNPKKRREEKEKQKSSDKKKKELLTDLAYNFSNFVEPKGYKYLKGRDNEKPPLLLDLKSCGALGVISNSPKISLNFVQHVVFELAYYHSPEDLQFVFFFDKDGSEEQNSILEKYKYMPHTNELLDSVSQLVFSKDAAGLVFGQLLSIMNERSKKKGDDEIADNASNKHTQIVCVVFDDYDIKETGFSKFLPEAPKEGEPYVNANGLTFIFVQRCKEQLPRYCGCIVDVDDINVNERKVSLRYNVLGRETLNSLSNTKEHDAKNNSVNDTDLLIEYKKYENEYIFRNAEEDSVKFKKAFSRLSAIYYTRMAENGKVPSMVTLFELYGFDTEKMDAGVVRNTILENWKNGVANDVTSNLQVPIGKNEHGALHLDLHEKRDGPHMLVAGTTGSGKSETIITYLIGLCMKYSPMDLNLMLVDMKGGGFSDRLGDLPHCVGQITDTAGEQEGTPASYMLKRFLESLNAEIKRRKLMLSNIGVDNVDAYIKALRLMDRIKELQEKGKNNGEITELRHKLNAKQLEALENDEPLATLSHLLLVVDEFTELKRFSSESSDVDFIAEITTIARVGRTLGFHVVLISQNIEGAITDDIRVNSKARICLKVATKQASKEMLDSPVAAAPTMPLNGRAYLLVGTGTRFEYFQSAYTGANKNLSIETPVTLTQVPNSGKHNKGFYYSKKDNKVERDKNSKVNENATQLAYIVEIVKELGDKLGNKPYVVFTQPLASMIFDKTDWEGLQ